MGGFFALLDPLLRCPTLVVEMDDGSVRPGERGDDEADRREELFQVMLDLGDHPPRPATTWPDTESFDTAPTGRSWVGLGTG
jgi:hypothetical protein